MTVVVEELAVDDIEIGERHRVLMGDIAALADSIKRVELLHPVVVTEGHHLVAGMRRIAAYEFLDRKKIPCYVVKNLTDARLLLEAEQAENTCRLDMTPTEKVSLTNALLAVEKPKAKARKKSGKSADGKAGGRGRKKPSEKITEGLGGEAKDKAAKAAGMSRPTYEKAKAVVEAAQEDPEQFGPVQEEMNRTGKVDPACKEVKEANEQSEKERRSAQLAQRRRGIPGHLKALKATTELLHRHFMQRYRETELALPKTTCVILEKVAEQVQEILRECSGR